MAALTELLFKIIIIIINNLHITHNKPHFCHKQTNVHLLLLLLILLSTAYNKMHLGHSKQSTDKIACMNKYRTINEVLETRNIPSLKQCLQVFHALSQVHVQAKHKLACKSMHENKAQRNSSSASIL